MYYPVNAYIELTYGCNRRCKFCFTQVLNKTGYDFMNIYTANKISVKLANACRTIKFSLRGEPLKNPNVVEIIQTFRENNPDAVFVLYTNGILLNDKIISQLFEVGVNYFYVDCYDGTLNDYEKKFRKWGIINHYLEQFDIYKQGKNTDKKIILVDDLLEHTEKIHNHAGNIDYERIDMKPLQKPISKYCLRPLREIAIFYNGDVGLCCDDAGLDVKLGNLVTDNFMTIWENQKIQEIRRTLMMDERKQIPCSRCNYYEGI